jgi:hypothetical protein
MKVNDFISHGWFFKAYGQDISREWRNLVVTYMGGITDGSALNIFLACPQDYTSLSGDQCDIFNISRAHNDGRCFPHLYMAYLPVSKLKGIMKLKSDVESAWDSLYDKNRLRNTFGEWAIEETLQDAIFGIIRKMHSLPPLCSDIWYVETLDYGDLPLLTNQVSSLCPLAKKIFWERITQPDKMRASTSQSFRME